MPRFVVLEHQWNGVHWDFMLEDAGVLLTWNLDAPPDASAPIAARAVPDHRLVYLDYEGDISNDRGHVLRWDRGDFEWIGRDSDEICVALTGARLCGRAVLREGIFRWEPRIA